MITRQAGGDAATAHSISRFPCGVNCAILIRHPGQQVTGLAPAQFTDGVDRIRTDRRAAAYPRRGAVREDVLLLQPVRCIPRLREPFQYPVVNNHCQSPPVICKQIIK